MRDPQTVFVVTGKPDRYERSTVLGVHTDPERAETAAAHLKTVRTSPPWADEYTRPLWRFTSIVPIPLDVGDQRA